MSAPHYDKAAEARADAADRLRDQREDDRMVAEWGRASAPIKQQARVATNLGALVGNVRAAMAAERIADEKWGGPDDRSDIDASNRRRAAEDSLCAALMALGVSPFDARAMVWSIDEQALAAEAA